MVVAVEDAADAAVACAADNMDGKSASFLFSLPLFVVIFSHLRLLYAAHGFPAAFGSVIRVPD